MGPRLRSCLPPLLLAMTVLAVFGRLLREPGGLLVDPDRPSVDEFVPAEDAAPGNDLTRLFLPLHLRVGRWVQAQGNVPGWDPAGFAGRPLVGNPQASLWYPPVWAAWRSGSPAALGWLTIAHLVWGALGAYRLGTFIGLGRPAAAVSGASYALAPYLLAQVAEGHLPHVWAACWFPWAFLAQRRWRQGDWRGGWWLPACLAPTFLVGHYQEGFYLTLVLAAWVVRDGVRLARSGKGRGAARLVGGWAALIAVTCGLLAIEWLPARMLAARLRRGASLAAGEAGKYGWRPLNLLQLFDPGALGGPDDYFGHVSYWEALLSFGWVTLVLAALAVAGSHRRAEVRGWLALAVAAVVFAAGSWLGLFALLYQSIPAMDRFRAPSRAMFLASLAVAMLGGAGVEAVGGSVHADRRRRWARAYRRVAGGVIGALVLLSLAARAGGLEPFAAPHVAGLPVSAALRQRHLDDRQRWLLGSAHLAGIPAFWAALIATGALFEYGATRPGAGRPLAWMMGALAVLDLAGHGAARVVVAPARRLLPPSDPIAGAIRRHAPTEPFRLRARDAFFDDLRATAAGLEKVNLADSFQLQRTAELYESLYALAGTPTPRERRYGPSPTFRARRHAVLDRMNVAFVVSDRELREIRWPRVNVPQDPPAWLYRNDHPLPRAYVVPRAEVRADDRSVVENMPRVDPRRAVMMPADPLGGGAGPRQEFTRADYDAAAGPDRVVVRVATAAPGLLVVGDAWMPGWSATLDDRPVPILVGDRAWRVVALPEPGAHVVVMRYEAPGLRPGAAITLATLGGWLLAGVAGRLGSRAAGS